MGAILATLKIEVFKVKGHIGLIIVISAFLIWYVSLVLIVLQRR